MTEYHVGDYVKCLKTVKFMFGEVDRKGDIILVKRDNIDYFNNPENNHYYFLYKKSNIFSD